MQITVHFFAQLREIVGAPQVAIEISENAIVADLLAQLYRRHPALEKWNEQILVGAGVEFVERDHVLRPNDEIAIMPPVQGG